MRIIPRSFFTRLAVATLGVGAPMLSIYPHLPLAYAQKADDVFTGHVVAVTSGDTMDVRVGDNGTVTVRLHGVECPPRPRALRETATRYTSRLVLNTDVRVEVRGTASHSVVYGEVFPGSGGESVNFTLAREGLATWASAYASQRTDLQDAEAYARGAQRGLWGAEDGTNVTLPPSAADVIQRKAALVAAKRSQTSPQPTRTPPPVSVAPSPADPSPNPEMSQIDAVPSPAPTPAPRGASTNRGTPALALLIGGICAGVLGFLSLVAYGIAHGLPFTGKRFLAQLFLALLAAGAGVCFGFLPVTNLASSLTSEGSSTPVIFALAGPVLGLVLLTVGLGIVGRASRLRGAPVDPRHAEPGPVKLHGVAQAAPGERVYSTVGQVRGVYVREVTSRYTATTKDGKRGGALRWTVLRDTASAVDFELFSSAGDGTGSALILAAQHEEAPPALAPARWVPYHVARFYNEVPTDTWFATAYEGDTRTEVFFVPNGATLTIWGSLYNPAPATRNGNELSVPQIASDGALGSLLICDGPEERAYAGRGTASLPFGLGWLLFGIVCAAGAVWGVLQGGAVARHSATASLGIGLSVLLVLAVGHGAKLARTAGREEREGETDPLRRPASTAWNHYQSRFPGLLIAPAVGE